MTVCIAAIYNNNAILGATDRMITSGDVEFEPSTSKIISLTNSIAVMTAGDGNLQEQILADAHAFVGKRVAANHKKWIPVIDVANFYRDTYIKIRKDTIEREILGRYDLTYDTFTTRQKQLSEKILEEISEGINEFALPDIETIVTGVDESGSHIYSVINDDVSFDDSTGFAAAGSGYSHALSHMMLSGHDPSTTEAKTLLTVHQAKKKAEVSPGVGEGTDMFVVGPGLGSLTIFEPSPELNIVKDLDGFYKKYKDELTKLDDSHETELQKYLSEIVERVEQSQTANPPALDVSVSDEVKTSEDGNIKKDGGKKNEAPKRNGRKTN
jgi:20S proteasome alpha/beta subunit